MHQDNPVEKFDFLEHRHVETSAITVPKQENRKERPLLEEREWDPTIYQKLLLSDPKLDKQGFPIPNSRTLESLPNNAFRIMVFDNRLKGRLGYDEARRSWVIRDEIPYEERRLVKWDEIPCLYDGKPWRILGDNDETWIKGFLATHYRFKIGTQDLRREIDLACNVYRFHSIRDWLNTLEADPTKNLSEDWLIRLCAAEDNELNRAYCVRILQAAVARAYEPGCELDTMPVLFGGHGAGKSKLWPRLVGSLNQSSLHVIFKEKIGSDNATRVLHSAWCVDLDECSSLKRVKDQDIVKQWLTTQQDAIVLKFKNETEKWQRSCFMVSSTNPAQIIKDPQGARRYWVIEVGSIDLDAIEAERCQLWAEAVLRYRLWKEANEHFKALKASRAPDEDIAIAKEKAELLHWSLPPHLWQAQAESVEFCTTELSYEGKIERFLQERGCKKISTYEIIRDCVRFGTTEQPGDSNEVATTMYKLGWKRVRYEELGKKIRGWEQP